MHSRTKGYAYALISTVLISSGYVLNYVLMQSMSPETAAFLVFGFSALLAAGASLALRKRGDAASVRKHIKYLAAFGLFNGVSALMWFQTVAAIGPALSGFLFRFATIFTIIMGVVFLKERFNRGEAVGMVLIVAGAFVITYTDLSLAAGALLAVVASFCFALVGLIAKRHLTKMRPLVLNNARLLLMFPVIALYASAHGSIALAPAPLLLIAFVTALLIAVIALTLYFRALQLLELSKVGVTGALEPLFVLAFSYALLQRAPTAVQLAGGCVIMLGAAVLLWFRKKPTVVSEQL